MPQSPTYVRSKAVEYAVRWWNSANPNYPNLHVDCTNFVSQCLYAGGARMQYNGARSAGWWMMPNRSGESWSYSWAVSHALRHWLMQNRGTVRSEVVDVPTQLELGDLIFYDWDGDGRFTHTAIVTAFTAQGEPLVHAHTLNRSYHHWAYRDSYAFTSKTTYTFIHIAGVST